MLCNRMAWYATLCCVTPWNVMFCHVMLRSCLLSSQDLLHNVMTCYAMLRYAVLWDGSGWDGSGWDEMWCGVVWRGAMMCYSIYLYSIQLHHETIHFAVHMVSSVFLIISSLHHELVMRIAYPTCDITFLRARWGMVSPSMVSSGSAAPNASLRPAAAAKSQRQKLGCVRDLTRSPDASGA